MQARDAHPRAAIQTITGQVQHQQVIDDALPYAKTPPKTPEPQTASLRNQPKTKAVNATAATNKTNKPTNRAAASNSSTLDPLGASAASNAEPSSCRRWSLQNNSQQALLRCTSTSQAMALLQAPPCGGSGESHKDTCQKAKLDLSQNGYGPARLPSGTQIRASRPK